MIKLDHEPMPTMNRCATMNRCSPLAVTVHLPLHGNVRGPGPPTTANPPPSGADLAAHSPNGTDGL